MKTVTEYFRERRNVGFVGHILIDAEAGTKAVIVEHDDGEYFDDAGNCILEECELSTCDVPRELLLAACG